MAITRIITPSITDDAVDNTKLDLTSNYAFTGSVTGAGAKVKLATSGVIGDTAGGVANVEFDNTVLTSDYLIYEFEFINIRVANDGQAFFIRVSNDNLATTADIEQRSSAVRNSINGSGTNDSSLNTANYFGNGGTALSNGQGNADGESFSGRAVLYNFRTSSNSFPKIVYDIVHDRNDGYSSRFAGQCVYEERSAIDGVQFVANSGNLSNGIINVYGVES